MVYQRITGLFLVSTLLVSGAFITADAAPAAVVPKDASVKKIVVHYFHGEFRCRTCLRIEELTKKAVYEGFKKELADAKIEIKIINTDKTENEHFIHDYNLTTRSVVVSEFNGSKKVRWKNLPKIWDYCDRERVFTKYIQDEIKGYL